MCLLRLALLCVSIGGIAQTPDQHFMKKGTFEQLPALILSNDRAELTVLPRGAMFASLVLRDDPEKLSPLWNPIRLAREAHEKNEFEPVLGHFVCVDGFGPVSPEEQTAGLPGHGEAHQQEYEVRFSGKSGNTSTLTLAAKLPVVQELLVRTVRLVDGENVIYVQSELESLLGFDRPVCWAEHATIGSPFLEPGVTVVDMSARRAKTRPHDPGPGGMPHRLASDKEFTWPNAPAMKGGRIDLRAAPENVHSGDHTTCLMDPARKLAFVTALHPRKRLILGYVFKREEFPWTQTWEHFPPSRKLARGLEFSTQPFDVPRRQVIQQNSLFDTPLYRWLPAKSKIESRFLMFYARTPDGFRKVGDVRLEGGNLVVEDKKAAKRITLAASLGL